MSPDDPGKYAQTVFYSEQVLCRAFCIERKIEGVQGWNSTGRHSATRVPPLQVDKDEKSQNKLIMQTVNVHEVRL